MTDSTAEENAAANTDREIWRKGDGDGNGTSYYEPSIHVTEKGAIGINVGGTVYVRSVEDWHALASALRSAERERDEADTILRWAEAGFPPWGCDNYRGAEYGPDGVPCPACGGDIYSVEPPERAKKLLTYIESVMEARLQGALRDCLSEIDELGAAFTRERKKSQPEYVVYIPWSRPAALDALGRGK